MFKHRFNIIKEKPIQRALTSDDTASNAASLPSVEETKVLYPDVSVVGIFTVLVFYALFINIYASAAYRGKLGSFTLSEAFKYGHRKTTTMLCVLFTGLYIGLMIDKGFFASSESSHDISKVSTIAIGFCLLLGFLFLFLMPPPHENNMYQSIVHFVLSILILIFIITSSVITTNLYSLEYKDNEVINTMTGITYGILVISLIVIVLGVTSVFVKESIKRLLWKFLAAGEMIIILLYSVILIFLCIMPKFINYKKVCVGIV